jgi:hypothetical protein
MERKLTQHAEAVELVKQEKKKLRSNPKRLLNAERIEMLGVLNSVSVSRLVSLRSDVDFEEQQILY